jgi:hypothetical protein
MRRWKNLPVRSRARWDVVPSWAFTYRPRDLVDSRSEQRNNNANKKTLLCNEAQQGAFLAKPACDERLPPFFA